MKKRIIACVLACATLLMGTGFAYWTETINIKTTAETGKLDVNFTDAKYSGNNFKYYEPVNDSFKDESSYDKTNRTQKVEDNKVTFDISELYPGHYEVFETSVANVGTVAAKLGKVDIAGLSATNNITTSMIGIALAAEAYYPGTGSGSEDKWVDCNDKDCKLNPHREIGSKHDKKRQHKEDMKPIIDGNVVINLPKNSTFEIDGVKFVRLSALEDVSVKDQKFNMLYLANGSNMNFVVTIGMDPDASGQYTTGSSSLAPNGKVDSETQHTFASVDLGLVWDQYNEQ